MSGDASADSLQEAVEICLLWAIAGSFLFLMSPEELEEGDFGACLVCCWGPLIGIFLVAAIIDWLHGNSTKKVQLRTPKSGNGGVSALEVINSQEKDFRDWVMKEKKMAIYSRSKGTPIWNSLWEEWLEDTRKKKKEEREKRRKEFRRQQEEEEARRQAAKKLLAMEFEKEEIAAKAAAKAAAKRKLEKEKEARKKKAQISKDQKALKKALLDLQKRTLGKKIDNVIRHSKSDLVNVTSQFVDIRKSGTIDQIKSSILSNFEKWQAQMSEIELLGAELTKSSDLDEIIRIEKAEFRLSDGVNHRELKKKLRNLSRRIERKREKVLNALEEAKESLQRESKQNAFSRPMLQTRDVPNATLNRKEKAWKLNDGSCIRCNKRSSGMAFYWDIFPDLQLVLICDECAAKEEFVHAEDSIGNDDDDLGDAFLTSLG